jgi:protein involved in polysaccharide export with SLBB domain
MNSEPTAPAAAAVTRAVPLLLLAFLVTLAACGARGGIAALPAESAVAADARLRPGDRIALKVFQEEEMRDTFTVGVNGEAILPRLGAVRVTDRGVLEVQDSLRTAFATYLRNPAVEVVALRRVGVHGEVNSPGLYLVDLTMGLRDVIAQAGGITDAGDANRIVIVRGSEQIRFNGRTAAGGVWELRSGDQIVVGQRNWIERNSLAFASTAAVVVSLLYPILREIF